MFGVDVGDIPMQSRPRRTPRKSLIVVLPDNHVVSPDFVRRRMPAKSDGDEVDVILACAGHPSSLESILRKVRDIQVLLAPAGTSSEKLRAAFETRGAPRGRNG